MSIFGDIWHKIIGADANAVTPAATADPATAIEGTASAAPNPGSAASASAAMAEVDIETILVSLAAQKGGDSNWHTSIVDLLKVLDLDSSLAARKQLADELNVHAGADGSADRTSRCIERWCRSWKRMVARRLTAEIIGRAANCDPTHERTRPCLPAALSFGVQGNCQDALPCMWGLATASTDTR